MDSNRKSLNKKYSTFEAFHKNFTIDDETFNAFLEKAEGEIEIDQNQLETNTDFYKLLLKALVARSLYDNNSYFEVLWSADQEINKALDVINEELVYETFGQVLEQH